MSTYTYEQLVTAIERSEQAAETFFNVATSELDFVAAERQSIKSMVRHIQDHLDTKSQDFAGVDGVGVSQIELLQPDIKVHYTDGTIDTFLNVIPDDGISITNYSIDVNGDLIETDSTSTSTTKGQVIGFSGIELDSVTVQADGTLFITRTDGSSQYIGNIDNFGEFPITATSIVNDLLYVEIDGTLQEVGRVTGEQGTHGIEVTGASHYRDPDTDKVYLDVTLSTGEVIRTGETIVTMRVGQAEDTLAVSLEEGELTITLPTGELVSLGNVDGSDGIDGSDGRTITAARLENNNELFVMEFSDGTSESLGKPLHVLVPPGDTSITSHTITTDGELVFTLQIGDESVKVNVGKVRGTDGENGKTITNVVIDIDENLVVTIDDNGTITDEIIGTVRYDRVNGAYINEFRKLVIERAVGPDIVTDATVDGKNGIAGLFAKKPLHDSTNEYMLSFEMSDESIIPDVGKLRPFQTHNVAVVGDDLVFTFADTTTSNVGRVVGIQGRNLIDADLVNNELTVEYDDTSIEAASGAIRTISGVEYDHTTGELIFTRNDATTVPIAYSRLADGVHGRWITSMEIDANGELQIQFNDEATPTSYGNVHGQWLTDITKTGEDYYAHWHHLMDPVLIGTLSDIDGAHGRWLTDMQINASGDLEVTWTDAVVDNVGRAQGHWPAEIYRTGDDFFVRYHDEVDPIQIGTVPSFDGDAPRWITDMVININRDIQVQYADEVDPTIIGPADGTNARWITGMAINVNRELEVTYNDTTVEVVGPIDGANFTTEITDISLVAGKLRVTSTDGSYVDSDTVVRRIDGHQVVDDVLSLTTNYTADPLSVGYTAGVDRTDGVYIIDLERRSGRLYAVLSDNTEIDAGVFDRQEVVDASLYNGVNNDENLRLHLTDGATLDLGRVKGASAEMNVVDAFVNASNELVITFDNQDPISVAGVKGAAGTDITSSTINALGELEVTTSDTVVHNGGLVLQDFGFAPYNSARVYDRGHSCTFNGKAFVALEDGVTTEPSESSDVWGIVHLENSAAPDASRPSLISPINAEVFPNLRPLLVGSPVRNYYSTDTRLIREYQVDVATGDFSTPVYSASENLDSHQVEMDLLADTEYKWRARDTIRETSYRTMWSVEGTFTVTASGIATPTVTFSTGQDPVAMISTPGFEGSAYSGPGIHLRTSWQVKRNSDDAIVYEDIESTDLNSTVMPFGILVESTGYSVRMRHHSNEGVSAWSDWVTFTTKDQFDFLFNPTIEVVGDVLNMGPRPEFNVTNTNAPDFVLEYMEGKDLKAHWVVEDLNGVVVWESLNVIDLLDAQVSEVLASGSDYVVRMRYESDRFTGTSVWSNSIQFTVNWSASKPIVEYAGDVNAATLESTFTSANISFTNDSPYFGEWEMKRVSDGAIVRETDKLTSLINQWDVVFSSDEVTVTYEIRFRVHGQYVSSPWSDPLSIVVENPVIIDVYACKEGVVIKFDKDGLEVWTSPALGGTTRDVEALPSGEVWTIAQTVNDVVKLDSTGAVVWTQPFQFSNYESHMTIDGDGNSYVEIGGVRKYDTNGNVVWTNTAMTGSAITNVTVDGNGNVYATSREDVVEKIDSAGNLIWTYNPGQSDLFSVAVDALDYVYIGTRTDTSVKKLDQSGGTPSIIWSVAMTNFVMALAIDSSGNIIAGDFSGVVKKIDPDGNVLWTFSGHTNTISDIAVDSEGYIYTGSTDNSMKKIDSTGTEVWSLNLGKAVYGVAAT